MTTVRQRLIHSGALFPLLAAMAWMLGGCDFGADDITVSTEEDVVFRFVFGSDSVVVGEALELASTRLTSLASPLGDKGYELEQVTGARVTAGVAEVLFPLDGQISFTDRVGIRLEADTTQSAEVALRTGVSSIQGDDTVVLEPQITLDVGPVIRSGGFRGVMILSPNEGMRPDEEYELAVQLVIQIDLAIQ